MTTHFKSGSTRGIVVKRDPRTIPRPPPAGHRARLRGRRGRTPPSHGSNRSWTGGPRPSDRGAHRPPMNTSPHLHHPVFGRSAELATLTEAYEAPGTRIALVVGWGGVGKSTLVSRWAEPPPAGCERVFGWSFTTQGTHERVRGVGRFSSSTRRSASSATPAHERPLPSSGESGSRRWCSSAGQSSSSTGWSRCKTRSTGRSAIRRSRRSCTSWPRA